MALQWDDWPVLQVDANDWITSIAVAPDATLALGTHGGRVHVWKRGAGDRQPPAPLIFQATP